MGWGEERTYWVVAIMGHGAVAPLEQPGSVFPEGSRKVIGWGVRMVLLMMSICSALSKITN